MFKAVNNTLLRPNGAASMVIYGRHIATTTRRWTTERLQAQSQENRDVVAGERTRMNVVINTKIPVTKKDKKEPIVKEFFLGRLDTDMIAYPEVLNLDQLKQIQSEIRPIQEYFSKISPTTAVTPEVEQNLLGLKMYGLNVPQHLHGSGYFETETEYASESAALNYRIGSRLNNHRIVVDLLNEYGSEEQKIKYLPRLATGEWVATIGIFEGDAEGSDTFRTVGTMNVDEKSWKVDGRKSHVLNAKSAQVLLLGVQTEYIDYSGERKDGLSLFLVDMDTHGVTVDETERLDNTYTVSLNNIIVSSADMLGNFRTMQAVGQRLLTRARLYDGHLATGLMKNVMKLNAVENVKRKSGPVILAERSMYQELGGHQCAEVYAIESAVYYTTALLDFYKEPDVDVECAIIKSYASKRALATVLENLNFGGPQSLEKTTTMSRLVEDVLHFQIQGEALHGVRQFIGLMGLQYAGQNIHATVRKTRNPMHNPMTVIGKLFRGQKIDDPKPTVHYEHYVHPSLEHAAVLLEKSIIRQQLATETLLTVFGRDIVNQDSLVLRLTELTELNFMMLCSLSRASRSYCIGLQYCHLDLVMAHTYCTEAYQRTEKLALELANADLPLNDSNWARAGRKYYEVKQYFPDHPLARTF